jgi:hypothetical protein
LAGYWLSTVLTREWAALSMAAITLATGVV